MRTICVFVLLSSMSLAAAPATLPATRPTITSPPASLRLDPFYRKYTSANGIPVVSSDNASDYALFEAAFIVNQMLSGCPRVRDAMIQHNLRVVVMAYNEFTTDVPEHRNMKPAKYWNKRARGLGASLRNPVVSCAEENLLCYPGDPYRTENILVHEFGHAIHGVGLRSVDPEFEDRLRRLYRSAMDRGLWKGTYAAENPGEYWAEAVQSWFDTNRPKDSIHNGVDTREKLKSYDPELARLLTETLGDIPWRYERPDRPPVAPHLLGLDRTTLPRFSWPSGLLEQ